METINSIAPKCRYCGKPLAEAPSLSPFCSEQCRLADLSKWFSEEYRVPGRPEQAGLDDQTSPLAYTDTAAESDES